MNSTFTPACNSPPPKAVRQSPGNIGHSDSLWRQRATQKLFHLFPDHYFNIFGLLPCCKKWKKNLSFVGAPVRLNMLNVPKSASASHKFSFCAWYSRCAGLCTEPVTAEFAIAVVVSMCLVPMLFVFLCILCCCKGCLRCCTVGFRHGGEMSPHSVEKYRKHRYF